MKISCFLILICSSCQGDLNTITSFLKSSADNNVSNSDLIDEYFNLEIKNDPLILFTIQLNALRRKLENCEIQGYKIHTYNEASELGTSSFFEILDDHLKRIYFVECNDSI